MTEAIRVEQLHKITLLPIVVRQVDGHMFKEIIVKTPHKGDVTIPLTETYYPFLFGSASKLDKGSDRVLQEISVLQKESVSFLVDEWKRGLV